MIDFGFTDKTAAPLLLQSCEKSQSVQENVCSLVHGEAGGEQETGI